MNAPRVHIVGAGLAGLSAAVRLSGAGFAVHLYEAAAHAGGRCRSYYDDMLDTRIDNGNHLLLSGNRAALAYLDEIGARETLRGPAQANFPFLDLESGERWCVRPNAGPVPLWVFDARRRVGGTRVHDYLSVLNLLFAGGDDTVADRFDTGSPLFKRFWEPFSLAVLNAPPDKAAAQLLRPVLKETFLKGEAYCRPLIAAHGLSESFVDPALETLKRAGAQTRFNRRLSQVAMDGQWITRLRFGERVIDVAAGDPVILALPPGVIAQLLPETQVPEGASPIVNGHFRIDGPECAPSTLQDGPLLGLTGGTAQWLIFRDNVISVTVSGAADLVSESAATIAERLWRNVASAIGRAEAPLPPYRIVKEKRATFAQTPAAVRRRPETRTRWHNLMLAGDWTATGLPATIEGAVRSGHRAAAAVITGLPARRSAGNASALSAADHHVAAAGAA